MDNDQSCVEQSPAGQWTRPYYGIQHYPSGSISDHPWRVTLHIGVGFATLDCWYPGCGFSPTEYTFDSVETARREGELYADTHGQHTPQVPRAVAEA
ncbi:MAG: hypothetical protein EPN36_14375 [Rhodanobacteraceae bacterium]|nr:MAG: hypothetical protein EPN36_14375 [Rhodanobacteraceae bacterium]